MVRGRGGGSRTEQRGRGVVGRGLDLVHLLEDGLALVGVRPEERGQRPRALPPMEWPERAPMLRLLETVIRNGTGSSARLPVTAYGKTGTTQDHRDAIFVGFSEDLVVGVWVGNDDQSPMKGVTGGGLPAEIWRDFVGNGARRADPPPPPPEPERNDLGLPDWVRRMIERW